MLQLELFPFHFGEGESSRREGRALTARLFSLRGVAGKCEERRGGSAMVYL